MLVLHPCSDNPNHNTEQDTNHCQFNGSPKTFDDTIHLNRIIEINEVPFGIAFVKLQKEMAYGFGHYEYLSGRTVTSGTTETSGAGESDRYFFSSSPVAGKKMETSQDLSAMLNWFVFDLFAFQPVFITKLLDDEIICSLNAVFFLQFDQTSGLMPVVCHTGHEVTKYTT